MTYALILLFAFWCFWKIGMLYSLAWHHLLERDRDAADLYLQLAFACLGTFVVHSFL